mmetsp:Transcript_18187/g.61300  ORF Transcript_18187/g.61300 Transcript_18187/m.61300 type:complete len:308 (+) Transcript_18187:173-1096(+)
MFDNTLSSLPDDCVVRVCGYLTPPETGRLEAVSKTLGREIGGNEALWAAVVAQAHGGLAPQRPRSTIAQLERAAKCGDALGGHRLLRFVGTMTDGGVDDELHSPREVERHWVDSLFRSETWKVYSSTDTTDAVVCVGAFDESAVFEERDAHDAERQFLLDRLRVAGEVWGDLDESQVDIDGDDGLSHEPPEVLRAAFLDVAQAFDEGGALAVLAQDVADPVARADAIVEMRRLYEIIALENAIDDEEDEDDEDDDEDDERAAPPPPPRASKRRSLASTSWTAFSAYCSASCCNGVGWRRWSTIVDVG